MSPTVFAIIQAWEEWGQHLGCWWPDTKMRQGKDVEWKRPWQGTLNDGCVSQGWEGKENKSRWRFSAAVRLEAHGRKQENQEWDLGERGAQFQTHSSGTWVGHQVISQRRK